ncbi:MAG: AMP-binding protein [Proteobacteria bacterium]|nr:AMP-binding protein [Pseudomonadota bacterium]
MHTVLDPLKRALQIGPQALAVIDGDRQVTYAEFAYRCELLVGALRDLGVTSGERVAILANNSLEFFEAYVGVPSGGMVVVPLNTRHAMPELMYALADSGAKILLTDRPDVGELANTVERVISLSDEYQVLLAAASPVPLGEGVVETDLAGLFYTGGTTGASKGVMLTHRNLIANALSWLASVPQNASDRSLVMAPMFHAAGSNGILAAMWQGALQVPLGTFDPAAVLDLIEQHRINMTLGVPSMLAAIAEEQHANPRDTSSLQVLTHGGSPIATQVLRRTSSAFPSARMIEVYGATETSPLATLLDNEETLVDSPLARSCGRAVVGCHIAVRDSQGNELPTGEVGEVVVAGTNIMKGYWNKPEQTAEVLKHGGYWTGDMGYLDGEGFLFLVDRSKDMIVSGGENVYSTEVEDVLYRHPGVLEAAVFGVPDDTWGEAVHAVVVPRADSPPLDPAELIAFCREYIGGYKVPKGIDVQHAPLPKSGPGKVLKRELRAPFWEGADRAVN